MRMRFRARMALFALAVCLSACEGDASRSSSLSRPDTSPLSQNTEFSSPEDAVRLADSLRQSGNDADAMALLARAWRRYPKHPAIASAYGRAALILGQEDLAADLLAVAVAVDPNDWRAMSALAVIYGHNGRFPEARKALMRVR